jgi:imidazolonepropionase
MREVGLIRNGAVLIEGQRVEQVGPQDRIIRSPPARGARLLDAQGKVVLPGFVDSHTHALFAASRVGEYEARINGATYSRIARAGGGIQASARHILRASQQSLIRRLLGTLQLFLEHGTTTVEVKSGYGLELSQELKMLRAIRGGAQASPLDVVPTLLIHDLPTRYKSRRAEYLHTVINRLIPEVVRERLAECVDVFCDRGYFSVAEARALLTAAARAGFKLKLHAEQLAHSGAALMASNFHALSVDHLDHLREADMPRLRSRGTIATLLPGSVFHLASEPLPPARGLIEAGVPVALATNFNPGSSPTANMQMILSLACSQMRLTPAEAVTAATINGAYALGRGNLVGSLEPGKQADLSIMDVDDYREIPYYFAMNHCVTVVKNGRVSYCKGGSSDRR